MGNGWCFQHSDFLFVVILCFCFFSRALHYLAQSWHLLVKPKWLGEGTSTSPVPKPNKIEDGVRERPERGKLAASFWNLRGGQAVRAPDEPSPVGQQELL